MIKVGTIKKYKLNSVGKRLPVYHTYCDVKYDIDGWADAKKFLPSDFDLCDLKIKDQKSKSGWSAGAIFDGLNLKENDEVLYWKKQKE